MDNTDNFAPYAAPENVTRVLGRARKGGIKRVDPDFLIQIGIGEGMVPRTLRALEFLGMITDDGTPTDLMERYVTGSDEDAQAVLETALRDSYALIFRAVDPSTDDRVKITNAFRTMKPSGQWTRMVTLFLGLCNAAGIAVREPPTNRPGRGDATAKERPVRAKTTTRKPVQGAGSTTQQHEVKSLSRLDPALAGIVAKLADVRSMDALERWWLALRSTFEFVHNANNTLEDEEGP